MNKVRILVVDDEPGHVVMLRALLDKWGYAVSDAEDGAEALRMVREQPMDLVLMDVCMEGMDGISALKAIRNHNPALPVLIMTAYSTVASAVEALKSGAQDYLLKPLDFDQLRHSLEQCLRRHVPLAGDGPSLDTSDICCGMVGRSPAMLAMLDLIRRAAPTESTVLVSGKSGTGKELVARAVHSLSPRRDRMLVVVNCAALSPELLESELFGHEKGAFTGADRRRDGRFFQAHRGSIFLDEIGEMPLSLQAKLLRALQQKEIQRVGSDITLTVDVRIIAASNRDLRQEVAAGRFREDLFYRLNVMDIRVPTLNQRKEDIPLLARYFLYKLTQKHHKTVQGFTPRAMDALLRHTWPGNVRELENILEQAVVLLKSSHIADTDLPLSLQYAVRPGLKDAQSPPHAAENPPLGQDAAWGNDDWDNGAAADDSLNKEQPHSPLEGRLEDLEREAILHTLRLTGDNKSDAAERLGISRKTLYAKLKRYDA